MLRLQGPQGRGLRAPSRAQVWGALGRPRDGLAPLLVEMDAGGLSHRAMEEAREKALGQVVMSQSALRDIPDRLAHAYAACRPRALRGDDLASVCIETVDAPWRRWGRKTGG